MMPLVVPLILIAAAALWLPSKSTVSTSAESVIATARTDEDWWNEALQSSTIIVATIHSYDNLLLRLLLAVMPSLLEDIVNEDDDDYLSANEVAASAISMPSIPLGRCRSQLAT